MSTRTTDALLWAQRTILRPRDTAACVVIGVAPDASFDDIQAAFHGIAKMAHPDLHRTTMDEEELELITTAYARAAAAYAELRLTRAGTMRMPTLSDQSTQPIATQPDVPPPAGAPQMNSRALVYYRKAELCLRRGELKGAVLQLKLAIAADPTSAVLRTALSEVETELRRT
ncbi:MAG TPA: hypothetical protein VGM88_06470 [Kofleriaceae bacterium]|jgi:hypothetical protein